AMEHRLATAYSLAPHVDCRSLRPHVLHVDINAGVHVVEHIPPGMVEIVVDDEIVVAVPAPVGTNGPIPESYFKIKTSGEPEAVMVAVDSFNAITERRSNVLEAAMLEGMINVITLVVRCVVAVPAVVPH